MAEQAVWLTIHEEVPHLMNATQVMYRIEDVQDLNVMDSNCEVSVVEPGATQAVAIQGVTEPQERVTYGQHHLVRISVTETICL